MNKPSFADSIPFYMTHETACELLRISQERRAKHLHQMAVRAEAAKLILEERLINRRRGCDRRSNDPQRFETVQDALNFVDRRQSERRFDKTSPMALPFTSLPVEQRAA